MKSATRFANSTTLKKRKWDTRVSIPLNRVYTNLECATGTDTRDYTHSKSILASQECQVRIQLSYCDMVRRNFVSGHYR